MQWNKTYGGSGDDHAYCIQQTSDMGFIVAGSTMSFGAGNEDFWLVKVPPVHDVAITNVTPSKTLVGQGNSLPIYVTVENQGDHAENFNVTVYHDSSPIETQTVSTLPSGSEKNLTFTWNTTDFAKGNYTIWAYATSVPDEIETGDNTYVNGLICVVMPGDADADGDIDIYDVVMITSIYGLKRGEANYNPNVDINGDDVINIYDVVIATSRYGEKDP
jgi:hypothetical protein